MIRSNAASKVSTLMLLVFVAIAAVSATFSDAFVPQPSFANVGGPNQVQKCVFLTNNRWNDRTICLFSSTSPSKSEDELLVIDSWQLLPDGRIKGIVAASGDNVLTSPLKKKNGLKEKTTVRTVSGSRYRLGTPASGVGAGNNLSADRLGVPRATLGGINGNTNSVRATQPLKSSSTPSRDGFTENKLANERRATMPLQSDNAGRPLVSDSEVGLGKKYNLLTPLVGGGSAIAIGAAIGSGVINDKGVDLSNLKNLADPSEVLKSAKSLGFPDVKSLKAPNIPSAGVSFPKFDGLPSISSPELPDVNLPGVLDLKMPKGLKMPTVPPVNVPISDGMKSLGDTASGALDGFFSKKIQVNSVGQGPYRVPMPYLDQRIVEAEKERRAQEAAEKALAAEIEEASRIQKIREEEAAKMQTMRSEVEAELMARQNIQREEEAQRRAEIESRIQNEADGRVKKAEEEAAILRSEIEKARLEAAKSERTAEDEAKRLKKEVEAALFKEKAAAEEAVRLKKEALAARVKEQAVKEEFTRKLEQAELAKLKDAQDFALKLAEAEEVAARARALEEESLARQKLADEAAARKVVATAEVRKASIGASAARKASYPSPTLSTYQAWQERQRNAYRTQMESVAEKKESAGVVSDSSSSSSQDNLSTYKKWQQNVAAKQLTSMSAEPVKAAYITGSPAPVVNQLVSGLTKLSDATKPSDTSKLSDAAIALNGNLGYTIAGTSATLGGIIYANEYYKIQDEFLRRKEIEEASKEELEASLGSRSRTSVTEPSLPPPVPRTPQVQESISATKTIDKKPSYPQESASATKEVSPPPPPQKPEGLLATPDAPPRKPFSVTTEATKETASGSIAPRVESNGISLGSRSRSEGNAGSKSSYSPFSSSKKTRGEDLLYDPPSTQNDIFFDSSSMDNKNSFNANSQYGATNAPFSSQNPEIQKQPASDESTTSSSTGNVQDTVSSQSNGASYLQSLSQPEESVNQSLKKSYSPFSRTKTYGEKGGLLNDPLVPQFSEVSAINQESYLDGLNNSQKSNLKKSYAPFGTKPKAAIDNEVSSSSGENEVNYPHPAFAPANDPIEEKIASPAGNYLEQLITPISVSSTVGEKSFSPFGSGGQKPKVQMSGNDFSHKPSSQASTMKRNMAFEEKRNATPVGNYLEQLMIPISTSSTAKKSFSPFGSGGQKPKVQMTGNDVLYTPPSESFTMKANAVSEEESDATPVGGGQKPNVRRSGNEGLNTLQSESSTMKGNAVSEEERDATPLGNYLDKIMKPICISSDVGKKSFSPFGSGGQKSNAQLSGSDILYRPPSEPFILKNKLTSEQERAQELIQNLDTNCDVESFETKNEESHIASLPRSRKKSSLLRDLENIHSRESFDHVYEDTTHTEETGTLDLPCLVSDTIHTAYQEWCKNFKKEADSFRFEIFSRNYKIAEEFHKKHGTPLMLNEFSDLTEVEYKRISNKFINDISVVNDTVVEDRILSAYKQWCAW
eukprot:CAMPEP_0197176980 /NCGR_PEP_ID=MMETSP1423-20130617/2738_1 /TAXON_ID=476441 /ORGANISM="Pseudo-nitzschia heimii, Strain UNC1101" /LENGTH=1486 /DNA_ID=CAMNT_0042626447 /DNA_START=168 /DNA_END=4625 /DNA_ORIENTATION=-